jgi:hypothetical protein
MRNLVPCEACSIIDDLQGIVSDCFADFSEPVQSRLSWAPAGTGEHLKALGSTWDGNVKS